MTKDTLQHPLHEKAMADVRTAGFDPAPLLTLSPRKAQIVATLAAHPERGLPYKDLLVHVTGTRHEVTTDVDHLRDLHVLEISSAGYRAGYNWRLRPGYLTPLEKEEPNPCPDCGKADCDCVKPGGYLHPLVTGRTQMATPNEANIPKERPLDEELLAILAMTPIHGGPWTIEDLLFQMGLGFRSLGTILLSLEGRGLIKIDRRGVHPTARPPAPGI